MNSMTGFGRAEGEKNGIRMTVEVKSVNHRFLDINIRTPRFMMFIEDAIRGIIKSRLTRGRVDVFVNCVFLEESGKMVKVDMGLLKGYLDAAKKIEDMGLRYDLSVSKAMELDDVIVFEEQERDEDALGELAVETTGLALRQLIDARRAEGERISSDIIERVGALRGLVGRIEQREPDVVEEYRQKLKTKLDEELSETEIDVNRFNAEILYFADRMSITEEIVRIYSHCDALVELLEGTTANGRSLDFIVQELNREFNTIGSKSADVLVTKLVIDAKSEVEKIREQVQNIE